MIYKELDLKAIGFRITEARARLRLSVEELAAEAGINRASMYNYESGKYSGKIYFETLAKISNALSVDIIWLCYGDVDHTDEINDQLKDSYKRLMEFPSVYKVYILDMIEMMDDHSSSRKRKNDLYIRMSSRLPYN